MLFKKTFMLTMILHTDVVSLHGCIEKKGTGDLDTREQIHKKPAINIFTDFRAEPMKVVTKEGYTNFH